MATITVQASGTTTPNDWTLSAGASKQVAVNSPDDDATTYIASGTTSATQQYFTASPALTTGDTITSISVKTRAKRGGASDCNFIMGYAFTPNGGGSQAGESAGGSLTATTNYADYTYTDSGLSVVWGSSFVFHIRNTQARNLHVTTLYVEITYTPAAQTLTGATIASGSALYAGTISQSGLGLVGVHIDPTVTMYAGTVTPGGVALTGATIAAGTTLYGGALSLYLTGETIAATTTLYSGHVSGAGQTLIGATIAATTTLRAGMVYRGTIRIGNVTTYAQADVSSASFEHTTPEGDNRLLVVVATYYDTAGITLHVWGSPGTGDGEFDSPYAVAVAPDGSVYVADTSNNRIQKFTAEGAFITKWGSAGSGDGQFNAPEGVAVTSDGSVYVTDKLNNRIQEFTAAGVFVTKWGSAGSGDGQFSYPGGISIAPDGSVYVADTLNDRIQKFTAAGVFVTKWGSAGSGNGQFDYALSVAVAPDGSVYVADQDNDRIQKFTAEGVFVTKWGSTGSGDGQFSDPRGVAVAPDGSVYVVEQSNNRIQKFTAEGVFVTKWGSLGTGLGKFQNPRGVAVAPDGSVYVADKGNDRIQAFPETIYFNTANYNGVDMAVGAGLDSGYYFQNFYTLADPPVGTYTLGLVSPTEPNIFIVHAISLSGVESHATDYTSADAGKAEQETSTTALQVSHNRTYPTNTLSLWALLYETVGVTLTAATDNYNWFTTAVGTLTSSLGFRPIPTRTAGNLTFGATAGSAVTQKITAVLHLEGVRGTLEPPAWSTSTTLYGGYLSIGQQLLGAHISGGTLYAGAVGKAMAGAHITTGTRYAGVVGHRLGGATIAATVLYGGAMVVGVTTLAGATVTTGTTLRAGAFAPGGVGLTGQTIANGMTVYAGAVVTAPVFMTGRALDRTTAVYAGRLVNYRYFVGAVIAPTTTLYSGALSMHSYLIGVFIGMENPIAISGPAFINIAALYAGMLALRIAAATAHVTLTQVFAGAVTTGPRVQTGRVYAGQVFHV